MDPALNGIVGPWGQFGIVGSVVVALGAVCWFQWRHIRDVGAQHLADVKACGERHADLLVKKIESDNALANALERLSDRVAK